MQRHPSFIQTIARNPWGTHKRGDRRPPFLLLLSAVSADYALLHGIRREIFQEFRKPESARKQRRLVCVVTCDGNLLTSYP